MDDLKKAIIAGLDVLNERQLRNVYIVVSAFCQTHGKGIIISKGKAEIV